MYTEKRASSWEVSDIEELAGREEGVYLEFKKPSEFVQNGNFSRDLAASELTETVSAFLNSEGGVMLVGVQTDRHTEDKRTELLKPLVTWSPDQSLEHLRISLTASQIRDLILGNIMPKPIGVEIKALSITVGESVATVFVITVPRSH